MSWEFPKIRGTLLGVPHIKDYGILGSILGYLNFGTLPFRDGQHSAGDGRPAEGTSKALCKLC